jgi:hypothetical protein
MEFVDVSVTYPKFFIDKASTAKLQKLFTRMVLEGNDSLDIDDALKEYTRATLNSNSLDSTDVNEYAVAEGAVSDRILIAVNITIAYHQHDILTLCKEETVKKDEVSSKTHQYYNIDLKNIAPIDLSMFRSDAFGAVCKALKQQLMTQNRAKNSDELNDLGFFNIDNLTLTTNFCFGENGRDVELSSPRARGRRQSRTQDHSRLCHAEALGKRQVGIETVLNFPHPHDAYYTQIFSISHCPATAAAGRRRATLSRVECQNQCDLAQRHRQP